MITTTSLKHPAFIKRIKRALWLAKLQSLKTGYRCPEYVQNRNGRNVIRLDVKGSTLVAAYASAQLCIMLSMGMQ